MALWAAIDIGTNSTRLLVAAVEEGEFIPRERGLVTTRLGADLTRGGRLMEEAQGRTIEAVAGFLERCRALGVERIRMGATSAVREAANGEEFSRRLKAATGLELEVFSGEREAGLSFLGVTGQLPLAAAGPTLVIDIGGGSTELIRGEGREIAAATSLPLGAVKLTESYLPAWQAPVTPLQFQCLRQKVAEVLAGVEEKFFTPAGEPLLVVGVGGTVTTLAAIYLGVERYVPELIHGTLLPRERLEEILENLCRLDLDSRKKLPGLQPERAEIIVAGTAILTTLLQHFNLPEVVVSEGDILLGMLVELWESLTD
ncbi:MAG: Ppx/GppA phosphatase family protein [bacterium]